MMNKPAPNYRLRFFLVCIALIALVVAGTAIRQRTVKARVAPSVSTDQSDYHPGDKVTINGSGWQPFEEVTLTIYESDGDAPWQTTVTADETGSFTNTAFVIQDHDGGVSFALYATGSSGETATASFTDTAQGTGHVTVTANDPTSCLSFTAG